MGPGDGALFLAQCGLGTIVPGDFILKSLVFVAVSLYVVCT